MYRLLIFLLIIGLPNWSRRHLIIYSTYYFVIKEHFIFFINNFISMWTEFNCESVFSSLFITQ